MMKNYLGFLLFSLVIMGCTSTSSRTPTVSLLASHTIDTGTQLDGYSIGGLSEIKLLNGGNFLILSDARSTKKDGPSRFYTGNITFKNGIMSDLQLEKAVVLINTDGNPFNPNERDPEAFVLQGDGSMLYASEGSNTFETADLRSGMVTKNWDKFLPEYYYGEEGLRSNQGIEGMSLSPQSPKGGSILFVAAESALVRDGAVATVEQPSLSRILKLQKAKDGNYQVIGEYAYSISAIPTASTYGLQDNGVSAILALDENRLLLVERNGYAVKEGYENFDFNIRLYLVDLTKASNISGKPQIPSDSIPAEKHLLVNLSDLVDTPDNIEGITFGPNYKGLRTVILVSDNNFAKHQANKFYQISIPVKSY